MKAQILAVLKKHESGFPANDVDAMIVAISTLCAHSLLSAQLSISALTKCVIIAWYKLLLVNINLKNT